MKFLHCCLSQPHSGDKYVLNCLCGNKNNWGLTWNLSFDRHKRFDSLLTPNCPLSRNKYTHADTINAWSQGRFDTVTAMLKFLVVTIVGLPQHVPVKLYSSMFCSYAIISATYNGNVYHNDAPDLFSKATSVFRNVGNFSIQIAATSTVNFKSTITTQFSELFSTKLPQLLGSTKISKHSILNSPKAASKVFSQDKKFCIEGLWNFKH